MPHRMSNHFKVPLLLVIALLCLVQLQSLMSGTFAQGTPMATTTIYLPIVTVPAARPSVAIVGPEDKVQLKTLVPLLTWNPSVAGNYVVELSKDQSFSSLVSISSATVKVSDSMVGTDIIRYPTSNLTASTLYYWHIGLQLKGEQGFTYGDIHSFTTPKKSSVVLPTPPTLLSPKSKGAIVGQTEALVTWSATTNAVAYRVIVSAKSTGEQISSKIVSASDTSYAIPAELLSSKAPGPEYLWQVRTMDQNGWGDYSEPFQFRWIP